MAFHQEKGLNELFFQQCTFQVYKKEREIHEELCMNQGILIPYLLLVECENVILTRQSMQWTPGYTF